MANVLVRSVVRENNWKFQKHFHWILRHPEGFKWTQIRRFILAEAVLRLLSLKILSYNVFIRSLQILSYNVLIWYVLFNFQKPYYLRIYGISETMTQCIVLISCFWDRTLKQACIVLTTYLYTAFVIPAMKPKFNPRWPCWHHNLDTGLFINLNEPGGKLLYQKWSLCSSTYSLPTWR